MNFDRFNLLTISLATLSILSIAQVPAHAQYSDYYEDWGGHYEETSDWYDSWGDESNADWYDDAAEDAYGNSTWYDDSDSSDY